MKAVVNTDDRLVDMVYAALLGEVSWQTFLLQLSRTLPGASSALFFHDANRGGGALSLSAGINSEAFSDPYNGHFARINPWMPKAALRSVGQGVVAEQMLSRSEFARTEFYNDFYRKVGLETAVGVTIARDRGVSFMLSTMTSRNDPDANRVEAARLTRLAPHLRRAFDYYRRAPRDSAIAETVSAALQVLDIGLIVIGDGGRIKSLTPAAQRMVEEGVGLSISPTGRLRAVGRNEEVLATMTDRKIEGPSVRDMTTAGSRGPVRITLVRVAKDGATTFFEGPSVLVLIDPGHHSHSRSDVEILSSTFGLTPAELRVFTGVAAGERLRDIAESAEVTYDTVRKQLKSIFAKTGVDRQVELVRLAGRLRPVRS